MHDCSLARRRLAKRRMGPAALLLSACLAGNLRAQTVAPDAAPATIDVIAFPVATPAPLYVQPTVTKEMGDLGGKYFGQPPDPARTRHYYIAAEPELWNFAPEGLDPVCGKTFPPSLLLSRVSWKIRYIQYADANFSARVLPAERLGIMGPVLRGTTGEFLAVTFLNRSWRPLSMHPHGVKYDKDSEGSFYQPGAGIGSAIAPGARFTYVWKIDESAAPLPGEASSKAWLYHSHVTGDEEVNLGLIGSIIVTDSARARSDGTPRDVDREMSALFLIFNEGNVAGNAEDTDNLPSRPLVESETAGPGPPAASPAPQSTWAQAAQAAEENQRHAINGRVFGNLTGLEMNEGERVRWYLFGLGSESDLHSAHWHGARVVADNQRRTDTIELLPASMRVADMVADNPGRWLFHCHVAEHMMNGMFTLFTVHAANTAGVSRDPEVAFLGMPQDLATLRLQSAEYSPGANEAAGCEIKLAGQVTVPTPFAIRGAPITVMIGEKQVVFQADESGVCVAPEGNLLVENASPTGVVAGGRMRFEITLKGPAWLHELERQHLLVENTLTENANLSVRLTIGDALHAASCALTSTDR